jgi:DNA-binding phage protein
VKEGVRTRPNRESHSYRVELLRNLRDPKEAEAYLNAALEAGVRAGVLLALGNFIEAQSSINAAAKRTGVHRVSLHKMLSGRGNPRAKNLLRLFVLAGVRFRVERRAAPITKARNSSLRKGA